MTSSRATPDPDLVEQVLVALDDGIPADVDALGRVVRASEAQLLAALRAVEAYRTEVAREQTRQPPPLIVQTDDVLGPGTRLGSFVLENVLGQGGMGTVYRARQTTLGDRTVALKVLPQNLANRDPRFVERFRREATLAAAIHHPHIAEVYGFEQAGDTLCFAMRLVDGPTLHDVLVQLAQRHEGPVRPTSPEHVRRCVLLVRTVADALAEVHARGFVHRDVKPSNILLEHASDDPEAALSARPVLVDFGLLRPAGDTTLTGTGTMLGTPAYMSHDSMLGRDLDARADVFSLAATLHDLLTSTSPGTRATATAGMSDARTINPSIDARLAAILTMALQERKELRYEHGGALRDELDRWLRGESLRALPTGMFGRLRLWARRNPARAARVGVAVSLPVLLLCAFLAWFLTVAVSLTATASEAAAREAEGDLLGAARSYRALYPPRGEARLLPWLRGDLVRARAYWAPDGPLQPAVRHLVAAEESLELGTIGVGGAELEWKRTAFRVLEALLETRHRAVVEAGERYLVREASQGTRVRRVIALDALADYLLVQGMPQRVPQGLLELLRGMLLEPQQTAVPADLHAAAVAALANIRTVEAFACTVELLHQDLTSEEARIAGLDYQYSWLRHDARSDEPTIGGDLDTRIDKALLERWASGIEQQAARHRDPVLENAARHLAFWEHDPERDPASVLQRTLDLSPAMRLEVDTAHRRLAADWAAGKTMIESGTGIDVEHPYHWYLIASGRAVHEFEQAVWRPWPGEDDDVTLASVEPDANGKSGRLQFGRDGVVKVSGTISEVVCRAAEKSNWEGDPGQDWDSYDRSGFLKLFRPGHSQLRIRSRVPADTARLHIVIAQMIGARSIVRSNGNATFRVRLADTEWRTDSLVENCVNYGRKRDDERTDRDADRDEGELTVYDVPRHVIGNADEVEVVLEYLYGNTTWRVMAVDLRWNPPPPKWEAK